MAVVTRQATLFAAEDWKSLYTTFRTADFQSYDYETLRKTMVDYIRTYYPEDFNDYIESSEFVAMLDLLAFTGQSIAFRTDLNARENFLATAERRDSIYRLANMLGYSPKRHKSASGFLKITSVKTTEALFDSNGINLANQVIFWDDPVNLDWQEQFVTVLNATLQQTQRIGKPAGRLSIGNIAHELYQFKLRPNLVPLFTFNAALEGSSYPFELYNVGLDSDLGVYELPPQPSDGFGFLFKSDGKGNSSVNTGFFMAMKQGSLNNLDFTLTESLPNRLVGINLENINNDDVWLFQLSDAGAYTTQWKKVDNLKDSNIIYNNESDTNRKLFTINSRINDQIDLIFGDGIFSEIPVGLFRAVTRVSNGLVYTISPRQMQNIPISIAYVSKAGKQEALIITLSLQYTINNTASNESLNDIKANAPQYYYAQNRMITGEDYNTLPYAKYNDIAKIKATNRTASGISRFLDVKDVTGKYSSTNIYCQDGVLYKTLNEIGYSFTWTVLNDIQRFIRGKLSEAIKSKESLHLFYSGFPSQEINDTVWYRGTVESNSCTGYFANYYQGVYSPQPIGDISSDNKYYLRRGCLIKFAAPTGYYFDIDGSLSSGTPTNSEQTTVIWATVVSVIDDGTNNNKGLDPFGVGPVVLSKNIPTNAIPLEVYVSYNTDITNLEQSIVQQIVEKQDFGLRYDIEELQWKIVTAPNLNIENDFGTEFAGSDINANLDSSWLIRFSNKGTGYNYYVRGLTYYFNSVLETRFYFDKNVRIYDPRTGIVVKDNIKILKSNSKPDTNETLVKDVIFEIAEEIVYADGYRDDTGVKVTFADSDNDGVPDDITIFDTIVEENVNTLNKLVYFERYLDYDNIERYKWLDHNNVVTRYSTMMDVELSGKNNNPIGTIFFTQNDQTFYQLQIIDDARTLVERTDILVYYGRSNIQFQYRHNSPNDRRIDPSPTNLIDLYILTKGYDASYRQYISDSTDKIIEPQAPSVVDLALAYQNLDNYKATSDAIIYNPVMYKSLFGSKANIELQATFKIVRSTTTRLTDNQLRNAVINYINEYFYLENWDFGDTFYFSELAAYLHKQLAPNIATIVIVPKMDTQEFGDLFQITSEPNEMLISCATVDDVEIIDSITASRLRSAPPSPTRTGTVAQTISITSGGNY